VVTTKPSYFVVVVINNLTNLVPYGVVHIGAVDIFDKVDVQIGDFIDARFGIHKQLRQLPRLLLPVEPSSIFLHDYRSTAEE
jgi:hypothetical protein